MYVPKVVRKVERGLPDLSRRSCSRTPRIALAAREWTLKLFERVRRTSYVFEVCNIVSACVQHRQYEPNRGRACILNLPAMMG